MAEADQPRCQVSDAFEELSSAQNYLAEAKRQAAEARKLVKDPHLAVELAQDAWCALEVLAYAAKVRVDKAQEAYSLFVLGTK